MSGDTFSFLPSENEDAIDDLDTPEPASKQARICELDGEGSPEDEDPLCDEDELESKRRNSKKPKKVLACFCDFRIFSFFSDPLVLSTGTA
jgi:hypothetical protein